MTQREKNEMKKLEEKVEKLVNVFSEIAYYMQRLDGIQQYLERLVDATEEIVKRV